MGLVFASVRFIGEPPSPEQIVHEIKELSGQEIDIEVASDPDDTLLRWDCRISFSVIPESKLHMYCYYPGAVKEECVQESRETGLPIDSSMEGFSDTENEQKVKLEFFIGQDETLCHVAIHALEILGGQPTPQSAQAGPLKLPIYASDLKEKHQKLLKQAKWQTLISILIAPILIPFWMVGFIFLFPYRLIKALFSLRNLK